MRIGSSLPSLALALVASAVLARPDVAFSPDTGLHLNFPAEDVTLRVGGRLHLDWAHFDEDASAIDDDFDVRRGRLYLAGRFTDDWRTMVEYDFARSNGWRSVWVGYDGFDHAHIRAGNMTMPFGLEEASSSNEILFNERSLASALGPSYGTGLMGRVWGKLGDSRWTLASGVYTDPFADRDYDRHRSDHVGVSGRATFAPIAHKGRVLQLGGSFDWRSIGGDDSWRVSRRPESSLGPILVGSTLSNIDSVATFGVEAAAQFGPVLAQGEWMRSAVQRKSASALSDPDFDGAYAQIGWVITGERHRYSRSAATFGAVKPRHAFGAIELAARWSTLDLNDASVSAGDETNYSAGLNWWVRQNLRLMFNYVNVDTHYGPGVPDDDPQIYALRFIYAL